MAKPHIVGLREWNEMAEVFSSESDRGAAISGEARLAITASEDAELVLVDAA